MNYSHGFIEKRLIQLHVFQLYTIHVHVHVRDNNTVCASQRKKNYCVEHLQYNFEKKLILQDHLIVLSRNNLIIMFPQDMNEH